MKKLSLKLLILFSTTFLFTKCGIKKTTDPSPKASTGNASANFNGTVWKAESAGALLSGTNSSQIMSITITLTEKDVSENITMGILSFSGVKTYTYGGTKNSILQIKYNGKNYSTNQVGGNAGTGTIKITEYVNSNGILNPGKVVGEFNGTLKNTVTSEILTITNGKFTAIKVL